MIKAIFFDFAGVLAEEGYKKGIRAYADKYSLDYDLLFAASHDHEDWIKFGTGQINESIYCRSVQDRFGVKLNTYELRQSILNCFTFDFDLLNYLRQFKKNIILGIISNSPKEWFDYQRERFSLDDVFDLFIISGAVGIRKPDVRIFESALRDAKVKGSEAIYVDDRADRVGGAESVGIKILIYENLSKLKEQLIDLM